MSISRMMRSLSSRSQETSTPVSPRLSDSRRPDSKMTAWMPRIRYSRLMPSVRTRSVRIFRCASGIRSDARESALERLAQAGLEDDGVDAAHPVLALDAECEDAKRANLPLREQEPIGRP